MSTASKTTQLDDLKAKILADKVCPELAAQATQLVFGDGNVDTDIVFIGEAPGKNEDIQGKPFVGAAGKFLNEMLDNIGLSRDDIYITNIVKYRPPNNRDPLPEEKAAFLPYLQAQLDVIQPKIVITLGRHSMNCFLPDLQISQVHGQPKRIRWILTHDGGEKTETSLVILPLFHPAAALYNGGLRQTLIDDFGAIPAILKLIETKNLLNKQKGTA
ncbi:MAG: Phage polymerase-related protein [Candidatus Saccharibacteria bacterium]|nr:Phage polymerase-related protein [Candidatus Saccharibacteria bacterium]